MTNYLLPHELRKGPAAGFLVLTEYITELRLCSRRVACDWLPVEQKLRELKTELQEFLAFEGRDHEIVLEYIIHNDRTRHILESWQTGRVNQHGRRVLVHQERYMRQRQQAAREHKQEL